MDGNSCQFGVVDVFTIENYVIGAIPPSPSFEIDVPQDQALTASQRLS